MYCSLTKLSFVHNIVLLPIPENYNQVDQRNGRDWRHPMARALRQRANKQKNNIIRKERIYEPYKDS